MLAPRSQEVGSWTYRKTGMTRAFLPAIRFPAQNSSAILVGVDQGPTPFQNAWLPGLLACFSEQNLKSARPHRERVGALPPALVETHRFVRRAVVRSPMAGSGRVSGFARLALKGDHKRLPDGIVDPCGPGQGRKPLLEQFELGLTRYTFSGGTSMRRANRKSSIRLFTISGRPRIQACPVRQAL